MDVRRRRFAAALAGFVAWLAALVTLIILDGRKPEVRSEAPAAAQSDRG